MEIEMIQAVQSAEEIIDEIIEEDIWSQILSIVNKTMEEYEEVIINPRFPNQKVKVGSEMPEREKAEVIQFLKDHITNFAWATSEMLGPHIAVHKRKIDPTFPLVRQKVRVFRDEKS